MSEPKRQLGLLSEVFGTYSSAFVNRHLHALEEFHPFVGCMHRFHPRVFPYEPVHVLRSSRLIDRMANAAVRRLPRRLRWTDTIESGRILRGLLRRYEPSVLYVHFAWMAARFADVLRSAGIPYVLILHGHDLSVSHRWPRSVGARRLRAAFRGAARCLFVSQHVLRMGLELGCPSDRAELFYLGVPIPEATAPVGSNGTVRFVCVGRLVEQKGQPVLLEAFARAARRHPTATLTLIGEGSLRRSLEHRAEHLGIADRIQLAGSLTNQRVYEELLKCDVYVQPSRRLHDGQEEGLGLAVQEAMAAGLPVVGSAAGGINLALQADIEAGFLPEAILDEVVLIVNAFVHPSAAIAKRIEFNNYKAMRQAVRKAIEGRPTLGELINEKASARHPFRYAP